MPSLVPVLCNVPRAQNDTLGCEDSTKVKHCANHVTPLCPELLFSSYPRKVLLQALETWPTLYLHNSRHFQVFAVIISPMSSTRWHVHVYNSPISLVKGNISNFAFFSIKTTQHNNQPSLIINIISPKW
jgi:hypothetical protein